ncbi:MAG: phage integrase N-terminal SAM-like domain-containing protein [Bacteroidales bacterium]|nr:phage integrase N-terminal SAM-like domain-containing protein [Bacteroidales bacterium]
MTWEQNLARDFKKMRNRMVFENLSPRTIRSYIHYPLKLAEFFNANPRTLTTEEIYAFLVYLSKKKSILVAAPCVLL